MLRVTLIVIVLTGCATRNDAECWPGAAEALRQIKEKVARQTSEADYERDPHLHRRYLDGFKEGIEHVVENACYVDLLSIYPSSPASNAYVAGLGDGEKLGKALTRMKPCEETADQPVSFD